MSHVTTTILIDLPISLAALVDMVNRLAAPMNEPRVWRAEAQAFDQRDGTPTRLVLSIQGGAEEEAGNGG